MKNPCELGNHPNDPRSHIEDAARICLTYVLAASVDQAQQVQFSAEFQGLLMFR